MKRTMRMAGRRSGFTLIEVVVAMVLLAVVLTMLASFSMGTAVQLVKLSQSDVRQAVTLGEVNRLAALPYDSLPAAAAADGDRAGSHLLRLTDGNRAGPSGHHTPQLAGTYADTLVIQRAAAAYNPFNTP
jgi:prepilin-type N-terminal cleavage/methylation domain-containing protein